MGYEITWPNIIRIDRTYMPRLTLDWDRVKPLELNAASMPKLAELAPTVDGKPDVTKVAQIDLAGLAQEYRTQKVIFETARDVYDQMRKEWKGNKEFLLAQVARIVEQFITSDKLIIRPDTFNADDLKRRLIITLGMNKVMHHIGEAIRFSNTHKLVPVFDRDRPIRSTGDMMTWYTAKPCAYTQKSHINFCVYDSAWEASDAFHLDHNPKVTAWVKNDHLGFEILYVYRGVVRKYRPDFIIRLTNGDHLVLETKGQDTEKDRTKRKFLDEWIQGVNEHGGFGTWRWAVSKDPGEIADILSS